MAFSVEILSKMCTYRYEDNLQLLMYYKDRPFVCPKGHSSSQIILSQDNYVIRYMYLKEEDTKATRDLC